MMLGLLDSLDPLGLPEESLIDALTPYLSDEAEKRLPRRVYAALRGAIRDLRLRPGQTVLEREVAAALGLSRTPVREALVLLEADHLVRLIPRKGFAVTPVEVEEMRHIYEVVEGLEGVAVALAADRITREGLADLDDAMRWQLAALEADDLVGWAEADETFHRLLLQASGNPHLERLMASYADHLHRARLYTLPLRPKPVRSAAEHRALVEAIRARTGRAARELHVTHWQRARAEILDVLAAIDRAAEARLAHEERAAVRRRRRRRRPAPALEARP
ncbi:MAG: GntR family transcriptional regulator [Chloroflexi bacterium]|nr:GntR family transcriptional regulator [Chloroflexota bacterium]